MIKETFEKIIECLEVRLKMCEKNLVGITSRNELFSMPLKEFLDLKKFCQEEQSRMDKVNSDLYHLIGMGNLTPIQLQKFCSLVRKYLVYRSDIKYLATLNISDYNISFPQSSSYRTFLGAIKLESEPRSKNKKNYQSALQIMENMI